MQTETTDPDDMASMAVVRIEAHNVVEYQKAIQPWDVLLRPISSGEARFHALTEVVSVFVMLVPNDLLVKYLSDEASAAVLSSNGRSLEADASFGSRFTRTIHQLVRKYVAHHGAPADAGVCNAIEFGLMEDLAQTLLAPARKDATPIPGATRRHVLRRALELAESLNRRITVLELAEYAGVSQRTLELCFQQTIGMTPVKYLRYCRLHQLHQFLLTSEPDSATVTALALRQGFTELGRVAVEYKQLFGERPSETLSRTSRPRDPCLVDFLRSSFSSG